MNNQAEYNVTLKEIVEEMELEVISGSELLDTIKVSVPEINRPGLALKGFFDYFGEGRVQIIGRAESAFLDTLSSPQKTACLERFYKCRFPCIIITRNIPASEEMLDISRKSRVPVLRTSEVTSRFLSNIIAYLNLQLAPRVTIHGGLVDVYGEGILITGESGCGKSETALELVKRGHRLVADDAVEIKKVSDKTLIGSAPEMIKHLIEIRGLGIIDVKNLFGIGSVKSAEKINLVVKLEKWDESSEYDRLGIEEKYTVILEQRIPIMNIPVAPGRNLAVIIEAAAINNRQRKLGYNTAKELAERLSSSLE